MTNLEELRLMLSDPFKDGFDDIVADDESKQYQLSHHNIKPESLTVYINNDEQTLTTDYTVDLSQGVITFTSSPNNEDLIEAKYKYAAFSDDELNDFLDKDGSVGKVIVRCVEILLFDSARRFDYTAGQTDVKASQVFKNLKDLLAYWNGKVGSSDSAVVVLNRKHDSEDYDRCRRDLSRDDDWSDNNV